MHLEPLYRATFTTPEHWRVALAGEHGTEEQEGGPRQLVGSLRHLCGDARYRWLKEVVCVLTGEVHAEDAGGLRVDVEVAALVWGPVGASASP